jgi:hypothetical protein
MRRQVGPIPHPQTMVGIRTVVPDSFENHLPSVSERSTDVLSRKRPASRIVAIRRHGP